MSLVSKGESGRRTCCTVQRPQSADRPQQSLRISFLRSEPRWRLPAGLNFGLRSSVNRVLLFLSIRWGHVVTFQSVLRRCYQRLSLQRTRSLAGYVVVPKFSESVAGLCLKLCCLCDVRGHVYSLLFEVSKLPSLVALCGRSSRSVKFSVLAACRLACEIFASE